MFGSTPVSCLSMAALIASIEGLSRDAISDLTRCEKIANETKARTYPDSVRVPRRMLNLSSLSRGPPNLMYDDTEGSRKVGLAILSKFVIIASISSVVAKREPWSLTAGDTHKRM